MAHWNPYQPPEDGLPPEQVRITVLRAEPWPNDGSKIRIHLEMTPFLERPNLQVVITDPQDEEAASIHIIESIDAKMTFTMHLRGSDPAAGQYALKARVYYAEIGDVDQKQFAFETGSETD